VSTDFTPGSVDYERQAAHYSRGRALSDDATRVWQEVAERWLAPQKPRHLLDLGSGTGRFSPLLAEWLDCRVSGVEPSAGMRETALRERAHPSVTYLAGDAASVPLADGSCDAAWMMHVIHHVPDRRACGRELARLLRQGSRLLVIGAYSEARREIPLFRYFTEALRILDGFPLAASIIADLEPAGLQHEASEVVTYVSAPGLRAAAERTRLRADTTLQLISDEEFARGQARLEAAAAAESEPQPVRTAVDLLVFRRS
jgi:ubiquinone/menaquinone biosynthesis C-methylase UbiE